MKKIIICTLMLYCLLNTTNQVIASNFNVETSKYSDKYIQWLGLPEEEKAKTIPPAMYVKEINTNNNLAKRNIRLLSINSKYNLLDTINLKVKNQMDTNQCWAMATTTQLESYMAKVKSTNVEYSTRHIEYSTAKTFIDGINEQGHNREIDAGGYFNIAYAYLIFIFEKLSFVFNIFLINRYFSNCSLLFLYFTINFSLILINLSIIICSSSQMVALYE